MRKKQVSFIKRTIGTFLVDNIADLVKYLSSLYDQEEGLKQTKIIQKMSNLHFRPIIRVIEDKLI